MDNFETTITIRKSMIPEDTSKALSTIADLFLEIRKHLEQSPSEEDKHYYQITNLIFNTIFCLGGSLSMDSTQPLSIWNNVVEVFLKEKLIPAMEQEDSQAQYKDN